MQEKIRLTCGVCQSGIRVRAATKAKFAICPRCQGRTPIPERQEGEMPAEGEVVSDDQGMAPPPAEVTSAEPIVQQGDVPEGDPVIQDPVPTGDAQDSDSAIQAPPEGAPVEGAPVEGAPVEGAPMEGAPVEGAPVEGAPVEGAPVQEEAPAPEPETESAPRPRTRRGRTSASSRLRGRRGRRGKGKGGDDDEEGAARYAPKKKGFNPIWLAFPLAIILVGAALYFTGFFEGENEDVRLAATKFLNAVKNEKWEDCIQYIQKKDKEEDQEEMRNQIRDFFEDAEEFEFKWSNLRIARDDQGWFAQFDYELNATLKADEGEPKTVDRSEQDQQLTFVLGKNEAGQPVYLVSGDSHRVLFATE